MTVISREEAHALVDPDYYYRNGYPWEIWAKLREHSPIHPFESAQGEMFWAVTRYQDIVDIESQPEVFENAPRMTVRDPPPGKTDIRMVVNMDPPDHAAYRGLVDKRFMPRSLEWVRASIDEIVNQTLDEAMARNGEVIDLQKILANPVPTSVICSYLGVPRELWQSVIDWTEQIINATDPKIAKGRSPAEVNAEVATEMFAVYRELFEERKKAPKDDVLTDLLNARFEGAPIQDRELYSWCYILTTAGHETTQSTYSVGLHALLNNPDQFAKLKENLALAPRAVDEILRYTSPAVHFCRTPNRDVELHGRKVGAGQPMIMFYPSGNHDSRAFERPDEMDIERFPNRHLAFGVGPHQCLGMHLARLELRVMFEHFMRRVESIELAGEPERVHTCVVGGYRHFPVRLKVRPRA